MVGNQGSSRWHLLSGPYLGEISALCFLHLPSHLSSLPCLLAGSGSNILVYDLESGNMARSFTVFKGVRVHGIASSLSESMDVTDSSSVSFKLSVFGEKRVKLFSFSIQVFYGYLNESKACSNMSPFQLLPNFPSWVLDVCFLKGSVGSCNEEAGYLAVGCSDNSVHIWDITNTNFVVKVLSPVRCLLYSMRLWGEDLEALRIASGTIFNEVVVWRLAPQCGNSPLISKMEGHDEQSTLLSCCVELIEQQYKAVHICKLIGHEGSIFRMAWSFDGSKLVSVSDDRSARIWEVPANKEMESLDCNPVSLILFGHNARVWDCYIFNSLIFTVSEDCTCRVWGIDGTHLQMMKEHLGRGIWRCLYDPNSSLLVTTGFDSAIRVHQFHTRLGRSLAEHADTGFIGKTDTLSILIPNTSEPAGLMDSKSEYVRCLHLKCEASLYVATNRGYLYHGQLSHTGDTRWTQLVRVCDEAPIVSMNLFPDSSFEADHSFEDWIAVGDGKGMLTVVAVTVSESTPELRRCCTWPAERERQLLGTFWCKSLGYRYIFSADPRGKLKLWRLSSLLESNIGSSVMSPNAVCIGKFSSVYGMRIICLDASVEEEVLVCGDLRGNLVLFPLPKDLLSCTSTAFEVMIFPSHHFKGAHGISSVSSITVARISSSQIEIRSTGADSCICHLEYDRYSQKLEFVGMKQVKELSLIESITLENLSADKLSSGYAAGFASVDFIVWNLSSETKVLQISCGGWRRPHSYYLGDIPERRNCFAYVKDDIIHIHKHWEHDGDQKIYPQSFHMQFHGREIHSLCFIFNDVLVEERINHDLLPKSSLVATGCEDGTLRLTWYSPRSGNWSMSKLLGEHVAGSAVRSICCVSKLHIISDDGAKTSDEMKKEYSMEDGENLTILISVGAKRVLTAWMLRNGKLLQNANIDQQYSEIKNGDLPCSSVSFQWLSTDMPFRYTSSLKYLETEKKAADAVASDCSNKTVAGDAAEFPERGIGLFSNECEDDWRYLVVTAFLVKHACAKITVCFVLVACSDATLTLRALVLPLHLWFDIALLVPSPSPVLALQHAIIPTCRSSEGNPQCTDIYLAISGSTDGSIAFWDLTESVETFMQQLSVLNVENVFNFDCQKRPRTGRGSQGGRRWRSLSNSISKKRLDQGFVNLKCGDKTDPILPGDITSGVPSEMVSMESPSEIIEVKPLHVFDKIHQSGVNCLHVSELRNVNSSQSRYAYNVVSGGDDQALNHLLVELVLVPTSSYLENKEPDARHPICNTKNVENINLCSQKWIRNHAVKFLHHAAIPSAHSSSVKGVWTDGSWVFSAGLDQRIRCWRIEESTLHEDAFLIVSVPEPEALCARTCSRESYQICVAGRGMQMVEFSTSPDTSHQ